MPGMRSASAAYSWFEGADVCSPVVSGPHSHMSTSVTMKYSRTAEDLTTPPPLRPVPDCPVENRSSANLCSQCATLFVSFCASRRARRARDERR